MKRLVLVLALVLAPTAGCGAAGTAAGVGSAVVTAAPKIRDVSCRGGRMLCRWLDTACRATGGPHVLPDVPDVPDAPDAPDAPSSSSSSAGVAP